MSNIFTSGNDWEDKIAEKIFKISLSTPTIDIIDLVKSEIREAIKDVWIFYTDEEPDPEGWLYITYNNFKKAMQRVLEERNIDKI